MWKWLCQTIVKILCVYLFWSPCLIDVPYGTKTLEWKDKQITCQKLRNFKSKTIKSGSTQQAQFGIILIMHNLKLFAHIIYSKRHQGISKTYVSVKKRTYISVNLWTILNETILLVKSCENIIENIKIMDYIYKNIYICPILVELYVV